ncbi:ferritin-like domain-containing protein [Pseudonocardia sp.]|uniref:ferritin-like domain-containing protein n=1 Tax=Pseudonocardia sp. TaxID=60912 RepID=UPI0026067385|nr:ferritin-like domain-containing protein [Pseudonocardia sp.]
MVDTPIPQSVHTATLITQLRTLERLTRTEVQIARIRVTQARTEAVRRELAQNAANGVRRADRISAQLRDLDAVPDVVSPAAARVLALVTGTLEQVQPVEEALLSDLTLEHQLLDRSRYVRTVADQAGLRDVQRLADDLVTAHTATVDWLTTVLAEEALGGPSALRATPLQRVAGGVSRAATLPTRVAVAGFNRAVHTVLRTGESARDAAGDVAGTVVRIGEGTRDVATAGRDAALRRAEQVAARDGADEVAGAVHRTRRDLGTLSVAELPIPGYDTLTAQNAISAVRELTSAADLAAVLTYEEEHKNRSGVVSATQVRYADVAKEAAGVER